MAQKTESSFADIDYLAQDALVNMLRDEKQKRKYLIIDVRDNDYIGGHVIGSLNIPSIDIEKHWPQIIAKYHPIPLIVFHCQYSEIRAPAAFQRYTFLVQSLTNLHRKNKEKNIKFQSMHFELDDNVIYNLSKQKWVVLEGGFYGWVCHCLKDKKKNMDLIQEFDQKMYCSK